MIIIQKIQMKKKLNDGESKDTNENIHNDIQKCYIYSNFWWRTWKKLTKHLVIPKNIYDPV